jgi:ribosomal protein S18 acetylase RimI-like enzyme
MTEVTLRHAEAADHARVVAVVDGWWGGRPMAAMLPRLFFVHFGSTSFVAETLDDEGAPRLLGFLCGFLSQTYADEAYIHFVGVDPEARIGGIGRMLYERFFDAVRAEGRDVVRCVTSPVNTGSVAFHRAMGFAVELPGEGPGRTSGGGSDDGQAYDGPGQDRVRFSKRL